jgi:hypothetical protein
MPTVYVAGQRINLNATSLIAQGGEAEIYSLGGGKVVKVYKQPGHPTLETPEARAGAAHRLAHYEPKLRQFPKDLPPSVIAPQDLAYTGPGSRNLAGYTMQHLPNTVVLLWYADPEWRGQGGVDGNQTVAVFRSLHQMVQSIHAAGVVIGDFNDLNVLVDTKGKPFVIDADSMQYGRWPCISFTTRFLDPLHSEPGKLTLDARNPYDPSADWYAFTTMLFQSLTFVSPYGGVHRPPKGSRVLSALEPRVVGRVSVFHPDVRYPKTMPPLGVLPDEVLDHFKRVYQDDLRGVFPLQLLQSMRWTTCTGCGAMHARAKCPSCALPGAVRQTVVVRGKVTATRVFQTSGRILSATYQAGKLLYLYHESGQFRREDGTAILEGPLDPELRFRISRAQTLMGKRGRIQVFKPGAATEQLSTDAVGQLTVFDANSRSPYWIQQEQLVRQGDYGSEYIGDILSGRTLFWVGEQFGFGFYQAGQIVRAFVFDAERRGLNDSVPIPRFAGQLVDATCALSDRLAWFLAQVQEGGQLVNRCYVVDAGGQLLAQGQAVQGDGTWLGEGIRGHFATGNALFAAIDDGIASISVSGGGLVVHQTFPDTEPFVATTTQLLPGPGGIYAVSPREITLLEIRP